MRLAILLLMTWFIVGCASSANPSTDPFTVEQGNYRVKLTTEPTPLQVGQVATFIVNVEDIARNRPAEAIAIRPIVDMEMADGMGMVVTDLTVQEVTPGQFHINSLIEHAGDITVSVTLETPNGLIPIRFPPLVVPS